MKISEPYKIKYLFLFLLIAPLLMMLSSCGTNEEQNDDVSVLADSTAFDNATAEEKIRRLTEQIKLSPKDWQLYYQRSLLWYETGNSPRAMDDINTSIKLHVTNHEAYYTRGVYLYVQNRDSEALKDFKNAIDMGTDNPETFFHIGQIHFFRKEYDLADEAYDQAIKMDSMVPGYYFAKGYLRKEKGDLDGAISYYEEALEKNPTFIKSLAALHDIFLNELKDPDRAYTYNERILLVDSLHPVGRFNQGNFFFERANVITEESRMPEFTVLMKIAISEYGRCIEADKSFIQAWYNRGYCFYLIGKYDRALDDFRTVIELDPFNEQAFFMIGSILEYKKDYENALVNFRQAVSIDPGFTDAVRAVEDLERMK